MKSLFNNIQTIIIVVLVIVIILLRECKNGKKPEPEIERIVKIETKYDTIVTIDGDEYPIDELNDNEKLMVQHLADLNRKIDSATFNLQQLQFGRQAFVDALRASLNENEDNNSKELCH